MPEFRIDNWSGGITDNYLNAETKMSQVCDNLLIDRNAKLFLRHGSAVDSKEKPLTQLGNTRINKLIGFRKRDGSFKYLKVQGRYVFSLTGDGPSGHEEVNGPIGNPFFSNAQSTSQVNYDEWNDHIIACVADGSLYARPTLSFFKDDDNVPTALNCGLPALSGTQISAGGSGYLYTYWLHYVYRYNVGDVSFEIRGPTTLLQSESVVMDGGSSINLYFNELPTGSLIDNFDEANIELRIFRTLADGQVGYHVVDLPASAQTYEDFAADADIENGEMVYTTGGIVDYHQIPQAKYVTIVNGIAWYANIVDDASLLPKKFRVQQSIPSAPFSCHPSFYVDVEGEIVGISRFASYPIVFTQDRIYRLEGAFTGEGSGYIRARELGAASGCVGHSSIVRTPQGVFFAGQDGFYVTDGQSVTKISRHLDQTYPTFVRGQQAKENIQGSFDEISGRVYWAVSSGAYGNENDQILVLDPYWGASDSMTFTSISGGDNWTCTSLLFYRDTWYRSSAQGYTYIHSSEKYTDPFEDTASDAVNWSDRAVLFDWTSAAINFGTDVSRKWVTQLVSVFKNETNISVSPWSCNDAGSDFREMKEVRYRGNLSWNQSDFVWGSPDFVWNDSGNIIAKRRFPSGTLRCTHKQIKFTNAKTIIIRSDDYAPAIINSANKTVLLSNYPNDTWPDELVGYSIRFDSDNYQKEFEIKAVTEDTLIIEDTLGILQTGTFGWEVVGYRKAEKFMLNAATLQYDIFGESHPGFDKSDEGGNASS
jgi:hypothetical protein